MSIHRVQGERTPQRSGQRERGESEHQVSWEQRKKELQEVGIGASLWSSG